MRISREDSQDLAFVTWALACQAITMDEFRNWAIHVVSVETDPPSFFFDLIDFKGYLKDIARVIGFVPEWEPTADEFKALRGLAFLRGIEPYEHPPKDECLLALKRNPQVVQEFSRLLPGIALPTQVD